MKKFIIDHIDPFGQGVYKKDEEIFFIPKTLPGESGLFEVLKKKKGVHFCQLKKLHQNSPQRTEPICEHFSNCNGCHFLHTDYQSEINFKKASYGRLLESLKVDIPKIKVISSPQRFGYRNRIQLHYNLKHNAIGFKQGQSKRIIPVSKCQIIGPELKPKFEWIHSNWQKEVKVLKQPNMGHIEIYHLNEKTHISWNQPYADGGFTQVNPAANQLMMQQLYEIYASEAGKILDLFGGSGNLTQKFNQNNCLSVDLYPDKKRDSRFFHLNLFRENALEEFKQLIPDSFNTLIIDPPRSGFKQLNQWVNLLNPENLAYISCHPATMVRDIRELTPLYEIIDVFLVDLFPGTFHYEAMIFFKNRS